MLSRLVAIIVIVFAVAACETTSEETGAAGGGGTGGAAPGTSPMSSMPTPPSTSVTTLPPLGGTRGSGNPAEVERELVSVGDTVYFAFDSYTLDGQAQETLDRQDYLVAFGISPGRVRTLSDGEERPAVVGSNETAWAKNRRAVTVVVGGAAGS